MSKVIQRSKAAVKTPSAKSGPNLNEQKQDKRERIRAAALELFHQQGFAKTTTKEIAEVAGVASGTVFLYARDKHDLLCLVMHDQLAACVDHGLATRPKHAPLLEQLMHIFGSFFRMYGEDEVLGATFVRMMTGADGPNGQKVFALTFAFLHQLGRVIHEAQERGEIAKEIEPVAAAQNFFALYSFALQAWVMGFVSREGALQPGLKNALDLQIRGLRP